MINPDFTALAAAYGIKSRKVETRRELDEAIAEMFASDEAYVLTAEVETESMVYPMVPAGAAITNIIMGDENNG